jgi:UDPglucose 6-dehydrogenase
MREAVSIPLTRRLLAKGAVVVAYDPAAMENARAIFHETITYARDPIECIQESDCCIIVTEWDEFRTISPDTFVEQMRKPIVIDGRRIYDVEEFSKAGVVLYAIGLGPKT